jgi:tight adherence protein B
MAGMEPFVVAILFSIAVYCVILALIPKRFLAKPSEYTQNMLQTLENEAGDLLPETPAAEQSILRAQGKSDTLITRFFFLLPGTKAFYPLMLKAGLGAEVERFFIVQLGVFTLFVLLLKGWGIIGVLIALVLAYLIGYWRVKRRIAKRNMAFLASFPDALDMIVRSVRSGYPLNAAIKMVAENMQPPISKEFKQVADETAYGSNLIESLTRLTHRIDEPDVRFFVVMLTVQQDVGGNLSESLSNLSSIIRKRRHLRMKVKAMTSEGRATAYVLGALPIVMFGLIYMIQPSHLDPLFYTDTGNILLALAIAILSLGATIVWRLVNPEI